MFTDIEGYTAIMQRSEEEGLRLRTRHRAVFEASMQRHGGRLIQYFGDGTLSIFHSAKQALASARELQAAFNRPPLVPVRIGLHCGVVVLDEFDIIGDAVNIAARVESAALPGSVLLTETVARELSGADSFPVVALGGFRFKNDRYVRKLYALRSPALRLPTREEIQLRKVGMDPALHTASWWRMIGIAYRLFSRGLTVGAEHLFQPLAQNRVSSVQR